MILLNLNNLFGFLFLSYLRQNEMKCTWQEKMVIDDPHTRDSSFTRVSRGRANSRRGGRRARSVADGGSHLNPHFIGVQTREPRRSHQAP